MKPERGWLAIDIETVGSPWDGKLLAIGTSDVDHPEPFTAVFPGDDVPDWVREALANPQVGIVEHTLYDARWLRLAGWDIKGPIADTRVMAWNHNENQPLSLAALSKRYLDHVMDKRITPGGKFRCDDGSIVELEDAPWDQLSVYCGDDVYSTARLFQRLLPQPDYWLEQQVPLTSVLLDMECTGLPIDEVGSKRLKGELETTREYRREVLLGDLPPAFNLNSGDHVAAFMFLPEFDLPGRIKKVEQEPDGFKVTKEGKIYKHGTYHVKGLGLKPKKWTDSGARPKVDSDTLAYYKDVPWAASFAEYQKVDKVIGTYLEAFPRYTHDGRLYGTFNQAGTVSGRLSSSEPNLQNLPRRGSLGDSIRALFRGNLIVADFSQLEPRLMAHWSNDPTLIQVFERKQDIYRRTASGIWNLPYDDVKPHERDLCKTLVLAMGYGAQSRKLAELLTKAGFPTTPKVAGQYLKRMEDTYPRFFEWREEVVREARSKGFVTTLAGRQRRIGFDGEGAWKAERQAVNSVIQGSAADIVNATMLLVHKLPGTRILVQVHDELVCEYTGEPRLLEIQDAGEKGHGYELRVPLVFEPKAVRSWGEK